MLPLPDLPDISKKLFSAYDGIPRILIIEDNKEFGELLAHYADLLKCHPVIANSLNQAKELLEKSRKDGIPFALATIDWRFSIGEGSEVRQVLQGTEILQYIKIEHPNVACLMISGESFSPAELLDLRDYYGLDYYLSKDLIEPPKVARAILRAAERSKVVQNENNSFLPSSDSVSPRDLREVIDRCFNEEELRDLCFNIDIEYETLGGVGKSGKSRELITYAKRHGRYYELLNVCYSLRPHAF